MSASRVTYEVQVYCGDHWVLDRSFRVEAEARSHGKRLFTNPRCEGYRVVRDWEKPIGCHFETEIHSEFRQVAEPLVVSPIEDVPICTTDQEFYGIDSRITIGRLLHSYLERMVVTPTEIMHDFNELKHLLEKDTLVPTALARVASLQAGRVASESRSRRDDLVATLTRVSERARAATALSDLPDIKELGFDEVYRQLSQRVPTDDLVFTCLVALSRDLVQMRNWLFKLDYLMDQLGPAPETDRAEPVAVLDSVCADVLAAPPVLPELLGSHSNLLDTVVLTADLCQGRLATATLPTEHRLARLNASMASAMLVECRTVLFDSLRRQIKGAQPLAHGDEKVEREAFVRLLARLTEAQGILGGGAMAEALTVRFGRTLSTTGAVGRRQAIAGVVAQYPDAKDRLRYLFSLADSELGREHAVDIVTLLQDVLDHSEDARHFITDAMPLAESLEQVTSLYELAADSVLAASDRHRLADAIDSLLALYIANHQVVHRLDNPDEPLRERANRLVRLCAPGVLRSPRALSTVRGLVVAHLRQPDFDQRYIQDITNPAEQQRALRELHSLLDQAGFC